MKMQSFLFHWTGQTDKAKITGKKLYNNGYSVTVINCDPYYTLFNLINLGKRAYFGQQWRLALGMFNADNFRSQDQLINYIEHVNNNQDLWQQYTQAPVFRNTPDWPVIVFKIIYQTLITHKPQFTL